MNVEIRRRKRFFIRILSPRRIRYLPRLLTISGLVGGDLREHNLKIEAINCLPT